MKSLLYLTAILVSLFLLLLFGALAGGLVLAPAGIVPAVLSPPATSATATQIRQLRRTIDKLPSSCRPRRRSSAHSTADRPVSGFGGPARRPYDEPMPVATPIDASAEQLARVKYDDAGLVPAIVQEEGTGQVLMMAWMNAETLRMSLEEGRTVFWSRSRQEVWRKGDTSGDRQFVRQAYYDCDGDTLLFVVEQEGKGACHTGERSCFFRAFG